LNRTNAIWIFFVIVAVGLVLSWAQLGHKAEFGDAADPFSLLVAEPGCDLNRAPCAAYGTKLALVARVTRDGQLMLRLVGQPAETAPTAELQVPGSAPLAVPLRSLEPGWGGSVPPHADAAATLRVRLRVGPDAYLAEFALNSR